MRHTFKISFFLRRSAIHKNKKAPIFGRITVDTKRAEFGTHLEINPSKWNVEFGLAIGLTNEALNVNEKIDCIKMTIHNNYFKMIEAGEVITAELLRNMYNQMGEHPKSLLELFQKHNDDQWKLVGKDRSRVTCVKYDLALRRVRDFVKHQYNKEDIPLSLLNLLFIKDYEIYLKVDCNLGTNGAGKMIQILKRVVTLARNIGIIRADPFFEHRTKWQKSDISFLSQTELARIQNKTILIPRLDAVRDIFVFCSYTGLSYIDAHNLSSHHIQEMKDGSVWLIQARQKTREVARVPLLKIPLFILEKYNDRDSLKLLPTLSNQKMNSYLKELADICGIDKKFTFHTARHTFSTTICLDNGVPIETLSKTLGHTDVRNTQIYAKITNKKIGEDMKKLAERLNQIDL